MFALLSNRYFLVDWPELPVSTQQKKFGIQLLNAANVSRDASN
jgi:hypothetical protein